MKASFLSLLLGFGLGGAASAQIIADFTDGTGTTLVDQYTGKSGSGWSGAWTTLANANTAFSNAVSTASPLNGGGNYLAASMSYTGASGTGQGAVYRQFSSATVSVTSPLTYSFDFRADTTLTLANQKYAIWDRVGGAATGTDSSDTWVLSATYASGTIYWVAQNGSSSVTSTLAFVAGDLYSFVVNSNPGSNSYTVSITDDTLASTWTSGTLSYRNATGSDGTFLEFAAVTTPGVTLNYSIDNIAIQSVPEPAAAALLSLGCLLGWGLRRRSRLRAV